MKRRKIIKIIVISVVITAVAAASAVTIHANLNPYVYVSDDGEILTRDDSPEEDFNLTEDDTDSEDDVEDKLIREKREKMKKLYEENVKKAAPIFKKHGINEDINKSWSEEVKIVSAATQKLADGEFNDEEKPIVEMYLEYRYGFLNEYDETDHTEEQLRRKIETLIDNDRLFTLLMGYNTIYDNYYADADK